MVKDVTQIKFLFLATQTSIHLAGSVADRFHMEHSVPLGNHFTALTMRQALDFLEIEKPDIVVIFGSVESASWNELRIAASLENDHVLGAAIAKALHARAEELSHEIKVCLAYHHEEGHIDEIGRESQSILARGGLLLPWSLTTDAYMEQFGKIIHWAQAD